LRDPTAVNEPEPDEEEEKEDDPFDEMDCSIKVKRISMSNM